MYLTPSRPAMVARAWAHGISTACHARLSTELWGAVNAVRHAIAPAQSRLLKIIAQRTHHAHASVTEPLLAATDAPSSFPGPRPDLVALLNTRPALTLLEAVVSLLVTSVICTSIYITVYGLDYPLSPRTAMYMAGLAVASLTTLRNALLQRHYQALERDARDLGDADSLFINTMGLEVHAKATTSAEGRVAPTATAPTAAVGVHCYHGFGANTASWDLLRPRLAAALGGLVTCHDMPGFGLTSRPTQHSSYSLSFNGALGRAVLDAQGHQGPRVLVGHSLGSACVVAEVINNPKGVDAVVLIAPAVVAPRGGKGVSSMEQAMASPGAAAAVPGSTSQSLHVLAPVLVTVARALMLLMQPLMLPLLRSAVHSKLFWETGLKRMWYNPQGVTPALVDAYRLPQLVKGWDQGMLRFVYARLNMLCPILRGVAAAEGGTSQVARFAATVREHNIPVLLLHGAEDILVPLSNSRALAPMVPGAQLVVLPQCGHMPQEELPERVTEEVVAFLKAHGIQGRV